MKSKLFIPCDRVKGNDNNQQTKFIAAFKWIYAFIVYF